ncbi:MAG TPA: hypothetical protein VMD05_05030 [Candidatus Nanoarchaeia archaeon]|nr:hypothetical protein [Candidatus Nanoarchaeia archaeon]
MNVLGIVLTLISVLCTAGPLVGAVIVYQDNPVGLVMPPAINDLVGNGLGNMSNFGMPQLVSATYDASQHTETLVINFTNPVNMTFTLKNAYAEVRDHEDQTFLANATLNSPVSIGPCETVNVTVVCAWTAEAESYFHTTHPQASTINVDLTQLTINVNDIMITLGQPIEISNIPIGT